MKNFFSKINKEQIIKLAGVFLTFSVLSAVMIAFAIVSEEKNKNDRKTDSTSSMKVNLESNSSISASSGTFDNHLYSAASTSAVVSKTTASSQVNSNNKTQYIIDVNQVISQIKSSMKALGTKTTYSETIPNPATREILVETDLSNQDISNQVYNLILDMLDYDAYLEFKNDPIASPVALFDYIYSIRYDGKTSKGTQHKFTLLYRLNKQIYVKEDFDSDQVIKSVMAEVQNSNAVKLSKIDGLSQGAVSMSINIVKSFYSMPEAVEALVKHIESTVIGENNRAGIHYTNFDLIYYGKNGTEYSFILFLA